jgi:hypothetical protein
LSFAALIEALIWEQPPPALDNSADQLRIRIRWLFSPKAEGSNGSSLVVMAALPQPLAPRMRILAEWDEASVALAISYADVLSTKQPQLAGSACERAWGGFPGELDEPPAPRRGCRIKDLVLDGNVEIVFERSDRAQSAGPLFSLD